MNRLVISLSILILNTISQSAEIPVGSPVTDRLFLVSRELYGRGILDRLEYSSFGNLSQARPGSFEERLSEQFDFLAQGFRVQSGEPGAVIGLEMVESNRQRTSNANYVKLFPQLRLNFTSKLSSTVVYRIDTEIDNDPRYDGKKWNGLAGYAENATLDYQSNSLNIRFGIERTSWGFGHYGNLVLWRDAMPMTVIGVSYRKGIFEYNGVIGFLNPMKDELDRMEADTSYFTNQQRYLSAHSVSIRPFEDLSLSVREAVVYGGPGRRFEPAYAFPFISYHEYQLNSRLDDNLLGSVAADYRLKGRLWVYGEFLLDDFQVEKKGPGDYEPNQLAYLAGGECYDMGLEGTTISLEYARINNWTYNQGRPHNRFMNRNYPLGFPTGPDAIVLDWQWAWWIVSNMRLSYVGSIVRHGEGRIDSPWTNPWLSADHYSEPFPSGVVERQIVNGLDFLAFNKNRFWGNLRVNLTDIHNVENVPGKTSRSWDVSIDLGIKLPPFSWGF